MTVTKKTKNKLTEKAMLLHLTINNYGGSKKDKTITTTVCLENQAKSDAGSWWTKMIPKNELDPISAASMKCRNTVTKFTLPWMDGGFRILPSARFLDYSKEMRDNVTNYDKAVNNFIQRYPEIVKNASKRLGKLMQNQDLLSVSEMKSKFRIKVDILPMPTADDFRIELGDAEANEVKEQVEQSINGALQNSMADVWRQLSEMVTKIETTLKDPKKKFKNSLISNLVDFCKIMPSLNLTDDDELKDLRKAVMDKLTKLQPDVLRDNKTERKAASIKAKEMLQRIAKYKK